MKILLLADTHSQHTEKWALGLANQNIQIGLFSFNRASYDWYDHPLITVFFEPEQQINPDSTITKLGYLKYVKILKKIIKHFNPDILHAHYATSYGLVGALAGFKPFVLSIWGSDVYEFPRRSKLHKKLFQYNLKKADILLSTSNIMREELKKYTGKEVTVTPFGVDTTVFCKKDNALKENNVIKIGTIKSMEEKYGIIFIIEAAKILLDKRKDVRFKFFLIGSGKDLETYKQNIDEQGLSEFFEVPGRIAHSEISDFHNLLDIFLNVSIDDSESFGVATVEAMACERPVIVSDVGGLVEVVNKGEFGVVVPRKNAMAIADAIEKMIDNWEHAQSIGIKARQHVIKNYSWHTNINLMLNIYNELLKIKSDKF